MQKRSFLLTALAAVMMAGVVMVSCDKEEDAANDSTKQGKSGSDTAAANVAVKIAGTQVANVGETYATLLCRFTKPDGGEFTQAEGEAIMKLNPQGGFCLVEGEGTPTIKDSTINCIETARQGGVMSGTFNNLKQDTKYSVRAWLTINGSTLYGDKVTFTTNNNGGGVPAGYVDLGLPSGTYWKETNESGQSFYTYDEAVNLFGDQLPTREQLQELKQECQWTWDSNKKGCTVTGPNGNSIFLPAAGYRYCDGSTSRVGSGGYYWSSTPDGSSYAWSLYFRSGSVDMYSDDRCSGGSVRLVQD